MIKGKLIILKDKQVFEEVEGSVRLIGKPIDVAHKLKEQGYELLHIVDTDAIRGTATNFDSYDHLTYFSHIEVECGPYEKLIEKLLAINARVVISLPTTLNLEKFASKKRLLVGKINADYEGDIEQVYDLLIENATLESVKKHKKKRIIVYKKNYTKQMEKLVFAVIE